MKPFGWFAFLVFSISLFALFILRKKWTHEAAVEEADAVIERAFDDLRKDEA